MDFTAVREAALEAYRKKDHARSFYLIDQYIQRSSGHDRGLALRFKAAMIAIINPEKAVEGLEILSEALTYLEAPGDRLLAVVNALALCKSVDDPSMTDKYAEMGYSLLRSYSNHPEIIRNGFRLHNNLGLVAEQTGNLVQAYWHFIQATNGLLKAGAQEDPELACFLFWTYLHTSAVCRKLGRFQESQEALEAAQSYISSEDQSELWRKAYQELEQLRREPSESVPSVATTHSL